MTVTGRDGADDAGGTRMTDRHELPALGDLQNVGSPFAKEPKTLVRCWLGLTIPPSQLARADE
jgi:hypothetical protein